MNENLNSSFRKFGKFGKHKSRVRRNVNVNHKNLNSWNNKINNNNNNIFSIDFSQKNSFCQKRNTEVQILNSQPNFTLLQHSKLVSLTSKLIRFKFLHFKPSLYCLSSSGTKKNYLIKKVTANSTFVQQPKNSNTYSPF